MGSDASRKKLVPRLELTGQRRGRIDAYLTLAELGSHVDHDEVEQGTSALSVTRSDRCTV